MNYKQHVIAFIIFLLAGIYITYPLIFHMGDYVTGYGDELLIAWIHNWVIHALFTNPLTLFDTNIFYPYTNTLAHSDVFITSSLFALIPLKLISEPIVTVNFTLISSLFMLGFSVYLLAYYLTKKFLISLLSGFMIIFSPAVLGYYIHLQVLSVAYVPLAIVFFLKFLDTKKTIYFGISLFIFLLQVYNSFLPAYFIVFSFLIIFIYRWSKNRKIIRKFIVTRNIIVVCVAFILMIPVVVPYLQVSREFNYSRDIREAVHLSIQPEDMLFSSSFSRFYNQINDFPFNKISQNNEFKPGYLGFVFTFLSIYTIWYCIRYFKKIDYILKSFFTISLLGFILSLGPVLHLGRQTIHEPFLIPLPYALFYYVMPGFQGFRNAARWEMLFILAMVIVIVIVLNKVFETLSFRKKIIMYGLLFMGIVAEFNFPMQFKNVSQVKNFPEVHAWLATTDTNSKIIEMPIYNWNMSYYGLLELHRMYYSTAHFRKMVNGGSGFTPPPMEKMYYELDYTFPSGSSLEKLKKMGITYMIIHKNEYDVIHKDKFTINDKQIWNGQEIISSIRKNKSVKFVKQFQDDYVFEFQK